MIAELFFLWVTVTSIHLPNHTSVGTFSTMKECEEAKTEVGSFIKTHYGPGNDTMKWWCAKVDND